MTLYRVGVADSDREFSPRLEVADAIEIHMRLARNRGGAPFMNKVRRRGVRWARGMDHRETREWVREHLLDAEEGLVLQTRTKRGRVIVTRVVEPLPTEAVYESVPVPCGTYGDTWGAPRDGGARDHQGNDIFAPEGSRILAPISGRARFYDAGDSAGFACDVEGRDAQGTLRMIRNFHCLPDRVMGIFGTDETKEVEAGDFIAKVGRTGNAVNTPPHSHFEDHPNVGFGQNESGTQVFNGCGNGTACDPHPALNAAYGKVGGGTRGPGRPC